MKPYTQTWTERTTDVRNTKMCTKICTDHTEPETFDYKKLEDFMLIVMRLIPNIFVLPGLSYDSGFLARPGKQKKFMFDYY